MTKMFDVIVIGNGAVGLSIAHRLKTRAPELRLALVGEGARPGGASPAAGAMLNAWGDLVRDQFSWPVLVDRADLMITALQKWESFCEELRPFAAAPLAPDWGTLVLETGRGGASETETLRTVIAALEARGLPPARHARGRIIPDGWIDAAALLAALDKAVRGVGCDVIDDSAIALAPSSGGWGVTTKANGVLNAAQVVLANGPFAQVLIDQNESVRRATPRLIYEAGAGFNVAFPEAPRVPFVVRTLGRGAAGGFHIVPLGAGRFYIGATAEAALQPNWAAPERRLATIKNAFIEEYDPAFAMAHFTPGVLGFRALAADGFPLLGQSHEAGLWFATGMRRDGLTSSPYIASMMADALLDGVVAPTLKRFMPSRPLLSYKSGREALDDAAAGHGPAEQEDLASLYERLGIGEFGVASAILALPEADVRALLDHPRASGAG
jgi:glycine/D-amino acid oxidase-like deaminating enzyme